MRNKENFEVNGQLSDWLKEFWELHFPLLDAYLAIDFPGLPIQDREDIISGVFAFDLYHAFQQKGYFLPNYKAQQSWLSTVVRNRTIDFLRKNKRLEKKELVYQKKIKEIQGDFVSSEEYERSYYKDLLIESENWMDIRVKVAVCRLPLNYAKAIGLFYFEKKSYKEIASELEVKESTVRGLLFNAREKIKKMGAFQKAIPEELIAEFSKYSLDDFEKVFRKLALKPPTDELANKALVHFISFMSEEEQKLFFRYYMDNVSLLKLKRELDDRFVNIKIEQLHLQLQQQLALFFQLNAYSI